MIKKYFKGLEDKFVVSYLRDISEIESSRITYEFFKTYSNRYVERSESFIKMTLATDVLEVCRALLQRKRRLEIVCYKAFMRVRVLE